MKHKRIEETKNIFIVHKYHIKFGTSRASDKTKFKPENLQKVLRLCNYIFFKCKIHTISKVCAMVITPSGSNAGTVRGDSPMVLEMPWLTGLQSTHREAAPPCTLNTSLCQDLSNICAQEEKVMMASVNVHSERAEHSK